MSRNLCQDGFPISVLPGVFSMMFYIQCFEIVSDSKDKLQHRSSWVNRPLTYIFKFEPHNLLI